MKLLPALKTPIEIQSNLLKKIKVGIKSRASNENRWRKERRDVSWIKK